MVIEVALRALADPMLGALVFEAGQPVRPKDERACASDLLRKLREHAWLEDYRDPIDLKPTLKLSRAGKAFSETFADLDDPRTKTRQRNMRSARKALAAFIATRDADELLDAHEFASRVVQDLQDAIRKLSTTNNCSRPQKVCSAAWSKLAEVTRRAVPAGVETAPNDVPFRVEESRQEEESPRHPKLITLTAIHQHPLPRH